ncbi:MAG: hypothetical protein K9G33_13900 [Sneathiella sp.]|nr:hypothetical protein [Sneathiella sp.]
MAVSTDTIQMLLRQRQELREALLDLRQEIATLDASSLDLVNRNIRNQTTAQAEAAPAASPVPAVAQTSPPAGSAVPPSAPSSAAAPAGAHKTVSPQPAPGPVPASPEMAKAPPPPQMALAPDAAQKPVAEEPPAQGRQEPSLAAAPAPALTPAPGAAPAPSPEKAETNGPADAEADKKHKEKEKEAKDTRTDKPAKPAPEPETDFSRLLARAKAMSAYFLDHPAASTAAELGALDAAIAVSETAATPTGKKACYHTLQAAYRKVSSESDAAHGINGVTIADSRAGATLLWGLPLFIILLITAVFPLLVFGRTMADRMFTADFAADMIWSISLIAAFLWGTVGALTLLALNIALQIRRRRYDAGLRQSPALRGSLGGLLGCIFFMLLKIWLLDASVTAEFTLDMTAFAGGLLSAVIFAALQRVIGSLTVRIEPISKAAPTTPPDKK